MSKLKTSIILLAIIMLTGCVFNNELGGTESSTVQTSDHDGDMTPVPLISKDKVLTAVDIAPEYIIDSKRLTTYKHKNDPYVSYVNISEFITFMDQSIEDLIVAQSRRMTVTYVDEISNTEANGRVTQRYQMKIDAQSDTIIYNDYDMLTEISAPRLSQYKSDLRMVNFYMVDEQSSVEMNLSEYGMDIVVDKGNYYIPLYVANLLFTGKYVNVYEMGDHIYIFDSYTDFDELTTYFEEDLTLNPKDINPHVKAFLSLYFDYFYGLRDYKEIDTYQSVLDQYDLDNQPDFGTLHREIERFISDQNDLHTRIVSGGYMDQEYTAGTAQNEKLTNALNAREINSCLSRETEIDYHAHEDTIVVEVNRFSLDTRKLLKPVMEEAKNYENIIIDVSCNPGGNLVAVIELLSYMTDEEIPISYINAVTKAKTIESYETTNNQYLDKNFYVFTTAASYSAANYFASLVKDLELGVVFGEDAGGGACAITLTVLPDGAILVNSSNMILVNKDDEIIEDGIKVDYEVDYPINWDTIIDELENYDQPIS